MTHRYRLGVDVGGTFTDGILIDEKTGETRIAKVPSTPSDPSVGFLEAVERILGEAGIEASDVGYLVHGTTVATNAIIEGKLAPTGFITTEGFRDMLEIQRQIRPSLYDLLFEKPRPLAPRYLCFGIPERLDATGDVVTPLDEQAVAAAAGQLKKEGVEALAVCYLHAYRNSAHERRTREIVHEVFPEAVVSLSSEVAPEFREYFRASTTLINAGVRPHRRAISIQHRGPLAGFGLGGATAGHAEQRRRPDLRSRPHKARVHGRVGTGRRGHRRRPPRPGPRVRQHPVLRHGRHHGQGGTRSSTARPASPRSTKSAPRRGPSMAPREPAIPSAPR